ncbi:MAG: 50S ribosomal protein L21 [Tenericutes bacterium]|jgi:large subunit ribosomal protein L21|nr:50S ribosomal protein L21 [Mycoplasmatota bacterium]
MNAIIKTGGKQYLVNEGSIIYVEKIDTEPGKKIVFDEVLMLDGKIGNPLITNAKVEGEVLKHGKQRKIRIFKYTQKSRASRRNQGHRQPYTKVEIKKIG